MRAFFTIVFLIFGLEVWAQTAPFDPENFAEKELILHDGNTVRYKAYEKLYYVGNVEDSAYQYMNIYVPDGVDADAPIILRTFSNNFYSSQAKAPTAGDIAGMALGRRCVVCVAGVRGSNSFNVRNVYIQKKKKSVLKGQEIVYTGKMPTPVVDLKAAVRYLRTHDSYIPGNSERIVAVGVGSNSMLMMMLGVSANSPDFEPIISGMGVADTPDNVFATACVSPTFVCTPENLSGKLSLQEDSYLKGALMNSALQYVAEGKEIPDSLGAYYFADTFVTDDAMDYMVDFDAGKFLVNMSRRASGKLSPLDSATYYHGGLADSLDNALRRNMCDPFHYLTVESHSVSRHWWLTHCASENPEMFQLTYSLVHRLHEMMIDVDFRIPFDKPKTWRGYYSELLDWIISL